MAPTPEPAKHVTVPWPVHAARQLKFVIPGAFATYYIGVLEEYWRTLVGLNGPLARCVCLSKAKLLGIQSDQLFRTGALTAGGLGLTTVALLLYVISLYYTAAEPDVRVHSLYVFGSLLTLAKRQFQSWRDSSPLRRVITVSISSSSSGTIPSRASLDDDRIHRAWLVGSCGDFGAVVQSRLCQERDRR